MSATHAEAKRMLCKLIDDLDTRVLDRVVAEMKYPRRMTLRQAERVRPRGALEFPAESYRQAAHQQAAARAGHRLAAALLVDALLIQSAGSGVGTTDAQVLVGAIIDEYDINRLRGHIPTPEERMRAQWERLRPKVIPLLIERDGALCRYCGRDDLPLTGDHLTPIARGGTNDLENLGLACGDCNNRKKTKTEAEYRAFLAAQEAAA